jgi:indole-3-glycerol phosphate synthase
MSFFNDALLNASTPVIMEVKRGDAQGEDLFRGRSVREIVDAYQRLGAPCISVVTGSWFGGDDELLREVVALTDLPILKKDFIRTESQVEEAKRIGAAAVLLTADLLPASLLGRLIGACLRSGVTPFIEIASVRRLEDVIHAGECTVAASNKDIRRRERGQADMERGPLLLPAIRQAGAACAVSASGIVSPQVGAHLLATGFDALLVGTGLLRAADAQSWLDELVGPGKATGTNT